MSRPPKRPARRPRRYGKRRGGYRNKLATKTYAFKRWVKSIYIQNSDEEDPLKLISDSANVILGGTSADVIAGTYQVGGVCSFSLQDLTNAAEFTDLFDQYRIAGIKMRVSPVINVNTNSANTNVIPEIQWFRDFDDVTVPLSQNDGRQRQDTKMARLTYPLNLYCKPSVLLAQDGTSAAIVPFGKFRRGLFMDCNDDTVVYPTWKFFLRNVALSASTKFALRLDVCFYTQFKNVR